MSWQDSYGGWAPYVPVAKRRAAASKFAENLARKEKRTLAPVKLDGSKIAKTFWGTAWCNNLDRYSDYENRLPRGRTYARNGSVIDLQISKGTIKALVSGSSVYTITIQIDTLAPSTWNQIKKDCSQSIDSLLDLMQGKFDRGIMERLTQMDGGLFPQPKEIRMSCSCPDSAGLCKHIAATMYGVGNRLDSAPEMLFLLRAVDHLELLSAAVSAENLDRALGFSDENGLAGSDLGELFGIELDMGEEAKDDSIGPASRVVASSKSSPRKKSTKAVKRVSTSKKSAVVAKPVPVKIVVKSVVKKRAVLSTKVVEKPAKKALDRKASIEDRKEKVITLSKAKNVKASKVSSKPTGITKKRK